MEIRPIEIWVDESGRKRSRMLREHRVWKTTDQVVDSRCGLGELNETGHANIFVGVNPRPSVGAREITLQTAIWPLLDGGHCN